ncbi:hypothetical protein L0244_02785, partial [bacterium]|nr:hypothetical protein [bacterium]
MKLFFLLLTVIPLLSNAQEIFKDNSLKSILEIPDKAAIQSRIKFLADDKLKGRKASSPEFKVAVDYVINQFKQLGIEPKGDEGYLQKVIIRTGKVDTTKVSMIFNGTSLDYGSEFVVMPDMNNPVTNFEGEVIFVGQGISASHLKHDDYAGIDVKGKVVLYLGSVPEQFPASERAHFTSTAMRADLAATKGAIGAIAVNATPRQFGQARGGSRNGIQGIVNKNGKVSARSGATHLAINFYAV